MEGLLSYISIIDPRLLRLIKGKPKKFIRRLQRQNFINEEAFIHSVCGDKHNRKYYFRLKSRTITILQALAIISTSRGASTVKKMYDICQKKVSVGQKFLNNGERREGLRLIRQAYRVAIEYDFCHLACELSSILQHDHLYYHRNTKKADFYATQVERYLKDYTAEKRAEYYFFRIIGPTNKTIPLAQIDEAVSKINQYQGSSVKYKFYASSVQLVRDLHTGSYEPLIKTCKSTLDFFAKSKGAYSSHHYFILINLGLAQMAVGKYEEADLTFQRAESYVPAKSVNDYLLRLYITINALHAGSYTKAYELYRKNKKCRFAFIQEQFSIIEAYLCFLSYTGHLKLHRPFRLGKYLNETLKAQENKQGDNINILIAELLVYLGRDRGKFIDRIEAVQHYSYRHLKGPDTQRAKWFIKILCILAHPKVNFHPVALQRKAQRYIKLIESHPVRMGEGFAVEVIPYEQLLDMITSHLKKKAA